MGNQINKEQFKDLVKAFKMEPTYKLHVDDGKKWVLESWSSKSNPNIQLNSAFEFTVENIRNMRPGARAGFMDGLMRDAIEVEDYEWAAQLRDIIAII